MWIFTPPLKYLKRSRKMRVISGIFAIIFLVFSFMFLAGDKMPIPNVRIVAFLACLGLAIIWHHITFHK